MKNKRLKKPPVNCSLEGLLKKLQDTEMDFQDWLPELNGKKTLKFPLNKVILAAQAERNKFAEILRKINRYYGRRKKYEGKLLEMDMVLEKAKNLLKN